MQPNVLLHKKQNYNFSQSAKFENNIPSDFNWKLYVSILQKPEINTNSKAFLHFNRIGIHNITIYKLYYRTFYNIPTHFVEESYVNYLENKCNLTRKFANYKELYIFYNKIGSKMYPLNDEYYRVHFNIPDDFSTEIYGKRYSLNFDTSLEFYKYYDSIGKNENPIDDEYLKTFYKIEKEFDWKVYLNAYKDYFNDENINISQVFNHYYLKKYEDISPLNVRYYLRYYQIDENFNYEKYYMYNSNFIFKKDVEYILKIYTKKILLEDIYKDLLHKNNCTYEEKNFMESYHFLITNFSNITEEDDKRYFICLKNFINEYYFNYEKKDAYKIIKQNKVVHNTVFEEIEKVIKRERKVFVPKESLQPKQNDYEEMIKIITSGYKENKLMEKPIITPDNMKLYNIDDLIHFLTVSNNTSINVNKNISDNKDSENCEEKIEYYDEKIIEYVEKNEIQNVEYDTYEKYYNSYEYNFNKINLNDIYNDIIKDNSNLYFVYRFKYYLENHYNGVNNSYNNSYNNSDSSNFLREANNESIFLTFDTYPHIPIVLKNNFLKLGDNWCHTVVCCKKNEDFIKNICNKISKNINIIVLSYYEITYNNVNNELLKPEFWKKINGENLLIHNENVYILENEINELMNVNSLGYRLPNTFTYNKYSNGYGDFSIRKKSIMLECLENIKNIKLNNELCKNIKEYYNLDEYPEDILYSFFYFEIKDHNYKPTNFFNELYKLENCILVINYQFSNINSEWFSCTNDFVKNSSLNKTKYLEKIFSEVNV